MKRFVGLAAMLVLFPVSASVAQIPVADSAAAGDPLLRNVVTAFAMKSGRLVMSSPANPRPVSLPDGAYTSESGMILSFYDGSITKVQYSSGQITDIANMRLNRHRMVMLTPSTNALMAVTDLTLPSGTFTLEDGSASVTISAGRPTAFILPEKGGARQ